MTQEADATHQPEHRNRVRLLPPACALVLLALPIVGLVLLAPTAAAKHDAEHDRFLKPDCIDIFPAGVCQFLLDPWGAIRAFVFGTIGFALSVPLVLFENGLQAASGALVEGLTKVWAGLGGLFRWTGDMLNDIVTPSPETWALLRRFNDTLIEASLATGPFAPFVLLAIYAGLTLLVLLFVSLAVRAFNAIRTRNPQELLE